LYFLGTSIALSIFSVDTVVLVFVLACPANLWLHMRIKAVLPKLVPKQLSKTWCTANNPNGIC
jgi:hypothetical protein